MSGYNLSLVLATIRLRHLQQLCCTCLTCQALPLLQGVLLGFLAAFGAAVCSKLLHKALIVNRDLCLAFL